MVWCVLRGRLGNNLFQYAAASALRPRLGTVLDFSRQGIALTGEKIQSDTFRRLKLSGWILPPLFNRLIHRIFHKHCYQMGWGHRVTDGPLPGLPAPGIVLLDGYFQQADIVERLGEPFRRRILDALAGVTGRSSETRPAIAVHVRRGDFLRYPSRMVCDAEYFSSATNVLRQRFPGLHLEVYSDDPDWCRSHFPGAVITTPEESERNDPLDDLLAMATCQHQVISNSTFSWWAGWLNPNREKVVIAPDRWSEDGVPPLNLLRFPGLSTLSEVRER